MSLQIYLASSSPRRKELLQQIGVSFEVLLPRVEEKPNPGESPVEYVERIALAKARDAERLVRQQGLQPWPILAADTCVCLGAELMGKPVDIQDGLRMLRLLSGSRHQVFSGIALLHDGQIFTGHSESHVTFAELSEEEIMHYWDSGEPQDKAGSYAIQGMAGKFVSNITGSYSGIVGLPLYEVYQLLKNAGLVKT